MRILCAFWLLAAFAVPARADIVDSGTLQIGGQGIIGGTMTVQGSAFSVGGTTFVVTGGSVSIGTTSAPSLLNLQNGDIQITTTTGDRGIIFQDGTKQTTAAGVGGGDYIIIIDSKTAGTGGGTPVGGWQTRDLNTEMVDTGNNASVASNRVTLAAGTYRCEWISPFYQSNRYRTRLQNITDSATIAYSFSNIAKYSDESGALSQGFTRFTLSASKDLEVQYRVENVYTDYGLGVDSSFSTSGSYEIYTELVCLKE